jgi:hypothetical protein
MIEPVAKEDAIKPPKWGVITSFDLHCVYVRYGQHTTSEGNRRQDLEWPETQPS